MDSSGSSAIRTPRLPGSGGALGCAPPLDPAPAIASDRGREPVRLPLADGGEPDVEATLPQAGQRSPSRVGLMPTSA